MNLDESDRLRIIEWAKGHPDIIKVWLYGSRARGDNKPDSDIDLAIEMRITDNSDSSWAGYMFWHQEYKENPDLHLSHEVDLNWYDKDAKLERVGPGVEKDGILIYCTE